MTRTFRLTVPPKTPRPLPISEALGIEYKLEVHLTLLSLVETGHCRSLREAFDRVATYHPAYLDRMPWPTYRAYVAWRYRRRT